MRLLTVLFISILLFSCKSDTPDVSNIKINISTERFEKKLFDTTSTTLLGYLQNLHTGSAGFTQFYLDSILGVDRRWPADSISLLVNQFITAYRQVYDSAEKKFPDFSPYEKEIKRGLQFAKYYFPEYKAPEKIITFIGFGNGIGEAITPDALLVGLQHHLGKDFPLYNSFEVQDKYPKYVSRRFEPEYISINTMRNIIDDMFPERSDDLSLADHMIEKGKRLYLLKKLLPEKEDHLLIGYTKDQLKGCYQREEEIWDFFVKNEYLQVTDPDVKKNFIDEGPTTQGLQEGSPGNIGSFCGWQIVNKYMQKNSSISLSKLMSTDDETIFQETKYKP